MSLFIEPNSNPNWRSSECKNAVEESGPLIFTQFIRVLQSGWGLDGPGHWNIRTVFFTGLMLWIKCLRSLSSDFTCFQLSVSRQNDALRFDPRVFWWSNLIVSTTASFSGPETAAHTQNLTRFPLCLTNGWVCICLLLNPAMHYNQTPPLWSRWLKERRLKGLVVCMDAAVQA